MPRQMELTVEGQPVPKARPRYTDKRGRERHYTEERTAAYEGEVRALAYNVNRVPLAKGLPVRLRVTFVVKGEATSTPDLVNLASSIADALQGVWYENDSQVVELQCRKRKGRHPRAMIMVEALTQLPLVD